MLVFNLKVIDWKAAQAMTFTDVVLCAQDAIEWSEGVKGAREKQGRRRG